MRTSNSRGTISSPALRVSVSRDAHPLVSDSPDPSPSGSSMGSTVHVASRTRRATIRRSEEPSEGVNLAPSFDQTPEQAEAEDASEGEESGTNHGSDLDAELGGDDETDSNYDSDDFENPPEISSLILLEDHHCRAPTQVKSTNGSKVSCYCGKLGSECGRHKEREVYRCNPGYYTGMSNPLRGFKGHGRIGVYYTNEQYAALRLQENTEMDVLVASQRDTVSDGDEEAAEFSREARVSFGSSVEVIDIDNSSVDQPTNTARTPEELRASLEAVTGGRKKSRPKQNKNDQPSSEPYYAFIDPNGRRWILQDFDQVRLCLDTGWGGLKLHKVFITLAEATKWKSQVTSAAEDSASFSTLRYGAQHPPISGVDKMSREPPKAKRSPSRTKSRSKGKGGGGSSSSSSDDSEEDSDSKSTSSSGSDGRKTKKKTPRNDKRRSKRNTRGQQHKKHLDDSDPSSSESSSSSSEDSKSDSTVERRRSRRRRRRTTKKKRSKKRSSSRGRRKSYNGPDPSVGDKEHIHKLAVDGTEIDNVVGPPDMRTKDVTELFNAATDITSIPGMLGSNLSLEETSDDVRNTTEMAATLVATAMGRTPRIHDSLWQSTKRHAMTQIKDKVSLFSFVKAVGKDKEAAFKKQSSAIRMLMYRRHYSKDAISEYLQNGLLPRISRESFRCYFSLLQAVRQLTYDHSIWEGGPGKAMLDYHSIRLLQVRRHALSRKMLILETYVYLRDAEAKSFYHESMTENLWEMMAELTTQQAAMIESSLGGDVETSPAKEGTARCSHCRNASLHKLLGIQPTKMVCYFIDLAQAKARKAAGEAVAEFKENPEKNLKEICRAALTKHRG
jgi:hypothetical protein